MASGETQQSDDQIILDGINVSQFHSLVDLLAEWISNGVVAIRFVPNPVVEFDESRLLPLLKERNLPQTCISLIKWDISLMLHGILNGSRPMIVEVLTSNAGVRQQKGKKPPTENQVKVTTSARLAYVEQKIITSDLRKQYAIKDKAKTNLYYGTAWEVVRTQSQNDPSVPVGLTYTNLRIDTFKPSPKRSEEPFPMLFSAVRPNVFDSVALTMTLQDLNDLIQSLSNAAKAAKQSIDSEPKQ